MKTRDAFDPEVVQRKLERLTESLDHLAQLVPMAAADLRQDAIRAAATERFICRVVELAVAINAHIASTVLERVPGDYRETFTAAAQAGAITHELAATLAPSTGLRNVIAHGYLELDYGRLAQAANEDIFGYREYVRQVSTFAQRERPGPGGSDS